MERRGFLGRALAAIAGFGAGVLGKGQAYGSPIPLIAPGNTSAPHRAWVLGDQPKFVGWNVIDEKITLRYTHRDREVDGQYTEAIFELGHEPVPGSLSFFIEGSRKYPQGTVLAGRFGVWRLVGKRVFYQMDPRARFDPHGQETDMSALCPIADYMVDL